jgi:hypothetical protein
VLSNLHVHRLNHHTRFYVCIPTLQQTIPTYFDNQIVFASFQRKLQRWGFQQRTSRRTGHCEFCSPTFKRLGADKEPGNDGRGGGAFTNPALTNAVVTRHPTGQSGLRTLAAAAAAAAPPVEKEPREVGFRGEFLQKVGNIKSPPYVLASIKLTLFCRFNATLPK